MKATIQLATFLLFLFVFSCGSKDKKAETTATVSPKETVATTPSTSAKNNSATYTLNKGTINWTGSKLVGTSSHNGVINVALGDIRAKGDKITGGQFTIDMNSIADLDLKDEGDKADLEGHLKSPDFFDVGQFPVATFIITGVSPVTGQEDITHSLTGNLTIRGISKSITIPANIAIVGSKLTAVSPAFKIDRTQWGVEFHSSSVVGLAKDKIIDNEIALVLNLEATSNASLQ